MDKGTILTDYKLAKNHKKQIPILADLNACNKETIVGILEEAGYRMIFNTNGVDISVKAAEVQSRYEDGDTVAVLAKAYHVSQKGIREILGIADEETESGVQETRSEKDNDEITRLRTEIERLNTVIDVLIERISAQKERKK